jgi:hypothetical protein
MLRQAVTPRILQLLVISFIYTFLSILPWWLFAKYVLGIDLSSPSMLWTSFSVLLIMWLAMSCGRIIREKSETEKERISYKFALGYGKFLLIIVGIQFLLVIALLMVGLIGR